MSTSHPAPAVAGRLPASIITAYDPDAPIAAMREHPDNPRDGDVGVIVESFEANGVYQGVVVQQRTGYVLAGNHRLKAAAALGMTTLPALFVDVDDAHARRILLADNRTSDRASYDNQRLLELLTATIEADDLLGTGYTAEDVEETRRLLDATWDDSVGKAWEEADPVSPDEAPVRLVCKVPPAEAEAVRTQVKAIVEAAGGEVVG